MCLQPGKGDEIVDCHLQTIGAWRRPGQDRQLVPNYDLLARDPVAAQFDPLVTRPAIFSPPRNARVVGQFGPDPQVAFGST